MWRWNRWVYIHGVCYIHWVCCVSWLRIVKTPITLMRSVDTNHVLLRPSKLPLIFSHQPCTSFVCGRVVIIYYLNAAVYSLVPRLFPPVNKKLKGKGGEPGKFIMWEVLHVGKQMNLPTFHWQTILNQLWKLYGQQNRTRWHYATLPGSTASYGEHTQTCTFENYADFNSLTTVGYLLDVFIKLWIPSMIRTFTSAWS